MPPAPFFLGFLLSSLLGLLYCWFLVRRYEKAVESTRWIEFARGYDAGWEGCEQMGKELDEMERKAMEIEVASRTKGAE